MTIALPIDDPCSFCEYLAGRRPYSILHRDEAIAVLVTREQRGSMHVLMIPVAHRETIIDVSPAEDAPLLAAVRRAGRALLSATSAEGLAVWQNNGTPSHQSVPHVHFHVAATLPDGGTVWGQVPELSVEETDAMAQDLRGHWLRAA